MTHATEDLRKYNGELKRIQEETKAKEKREADDIAKDMTDDILLDLSNG